MTEIPQPVNVHSPTTPNTPTAVSRDHGLRIDVDRDAQLEAQKDEISPLTPRNSQHRRVLDDPSISPIDGNAEDRFPPRAPLPESSNFVSQIPRKVSQPRNGTVSQTKWDEYSGEPTTDDRGKPASVRPGTQPVEVNYPQLKERTKQILAGLREREAAKKKPWGRQPPPVAADPLDDPPQREPWKGQSGRAAIVQPVRTTVIPRKVLPPSRPVEVPIELPTQQAPAFYSAVTEGPPPLEEHPALRKQLRQVSSEDSLKPVVPLKTRNLTPDMTKISPAESPTQQTPVHSAPASPEPLVLQSTPPVAYIEQPENRVDSPQYDPEPTTPTTPEPVLLSSPDTFRSSPPPYAQPDMNREVSRFSWTTYDTSTVDSPRSTQYSRDMSPLPELPTAITMKKRPISTSPFLHSQPYENPYYADSNGSIIRKPVPGARLRTTSLSSATSMAMSTSKSLPPTPTVMEASDKIENLDAQLDSLRRRKYNISRIVADLEGALKKNAVNYDMWRRREVEKNITNHKLSLDEISSEIHELSIQLHRAQRKRDEKQGLEASSLWIKRVTS